MRSNAKTEILAGSAPNAGSAPQPIVFVAGLTHSGSTLLDLLLGAHERCVGLGEVVSILRPESEGKLFSEDRRCSCGRVLSECRFWSEVREGLHGDQVGDVSSRYEILLKLFKRAFGPDTLMVDSSKSLRALKAVSRLPGVQLKVILLVRDVRGWTVSRRELDHRMGTRLLKEMTGLKPLAWLRFLARQNNVARFLIWYHGNRRIQRYIAEQRIPAVLISYEELVLRTDLALKKLCDFLELSGTSKISERILTGSHIALGNPMRHDHDKSSQIRYDQRWLARRDWELAAVLLPHVMRYNKKWVYDNSESVGIIS